MRRSGNFMMAEAERAGAIVTARDPGIVSLALTGQPGGRMAGIADHVIRAPATRTSSIQEMHIVIGHMSCGFIEEALC
jgi:D-sedoheptulose 7-phosphate isomerase